MWNFETSTTCVRVHIVRQTNSTCVCSIRVHLSPPIAVRDVSCEVDTPPPPVVRTAARSPWVRDRHRPCPTATELLHPAATENGILRIIHIRTHRRRRHRDPSSSDLHCLPSPSNTRRPFIAKKKTYPADNAAARLSPSPHVTIVNDHVLIERTRTSPMPPFVLPRFPAVASPVAGKRNDRAVISLPSPTNFACLWAPGIRR